MYFDMRGIKPFAKWICLWISTVFILQLMPKPGFFMSKLSLYTPNSEAVMPFWRQLLVSDGKSLVTGWKPLVNQTHLLVSHPNLLINGRHSPKTQKSSRKFAAALSKLSYFLPTMFSGRTHSSNCSAVKCPLFTADSFNVVPSLCACFAIAAAFS